MKKKAKIEEQSDFIGFRGRRVPQRRSELRRLLEIAGEEYASSYLEIGLRHATTFHWVASRLPKGSRLVGVDLPGGLWGDPEGKEKIEEVRGDLIAQGYKVDIIYGDSTSPKVVEQVTELGPFDLVFIDGNHKMKYVKQDWNNYSKIGRVIALHDIDVENSDRPPNKITNYGVPKLWRSLVGGAIGLRFEAIVDPKYPGMGIGVIWKG